MKFRWDLALAVMLAGCAFMAGVWMVGCMIRNNIGGIVIAALACIVCVAAVAGIIGGALD